LTDMYHMSVVCVSVLDTCRSRDTSLRKGVCDSPWFH